MEKIVSLANVDLSILLLPFFSGMLFDFFQPGMVFSFYGDFLFREERNGYTMAWWKKPIGGCLKCMHIWVCFIFVIFFCDFQLIKTLLLISLSYFILTKAYYE